MTEEINQILESLKRGFLELIPNILISLVVLGIGYIVARLLKSLVIGLFKNFAGF